MLFRSEQQPLVEEGRRRFKEFLEAKGLEESNDLLSSVIHRLGEESKERFFIKLARDEVKLDTLFEGKSERAQQSFLSKLWRLGRGPKKTKELPPAASLPPYDVLIFGCSTWGDGDMQEDMHDFLDGVAAMDLKGKKIALFGCGDDTMSETFCNGVGEMYQIGRAHV